MGVLVLDVLVFTVFLYCFVYVYLFFLCFCLILSYVFLLLCLCILIVTYAPFCIVCFHHASWHSSTTLTKVLPCFFLSCNANARRCTARTLAILTVLFYVLFVCKCVLYYCHRVSTQLQLTNISTEWPQKMCTLLQQFGGFDSVWMPMVATSNTYIESKIQGHLSYQFCFSLNTVVTIIG